MKGVKSFPKDLRASHGFDNQANQLTLSPLLLDSFLRLAVSILESPDFNERSVGIWNDFFREPPAGTDLARVWLPAPSFLLLCTIAPLHHCNV